MKQWCLDGEIYTKDNLVYTANELILPVGQVQSIAVEYVQKGDKTTVEIGEHGSLTSAFVGDVDQTNNVKKGIVLKTGASVTITASAEAGYLVKEWSINNQPVQTADGKLYKENSYTYTATNNSEAVIRVVFERMSYKVSWSSSDANGTVKASTSEVSEYAGSEADMQGGTEVIFAAEPSEGYLFDGWTINGKEITENTQDAKGDGATLTWTVPDGVLLTPPVSAYAIQAKFVKIICL